MGEPKFSRPKFDTPSHPWKAARIEEEHAIKAQHGLKNMREIWKAKSQLRRHRRQAMRLIGMSILVKVTVRKRWKIYFAH